MISSRLALVAAALLATATTNPAIAQLDPAPTGTSKPQPVPIVDTIPAAKDVPYPGQLTIRVNATDIAHGIFRITETIPVTGGPLVLLAPKWLPGDHAPSGLIDKLAGFTFTTADGKTIPWTRDPIDVTAFHLDVPAGTTAITAKYDFLSPTDEAQGRVVMTPQMLNLQWSAMALYPAGYFVRQIMIQPTVLYPQGWTAATALRPAGAPAADGAITYNPVAFDTLIDSPIFAGKYRLTEQLSPRVTLNVFADSPAMLKVDPKVLAIHRRIVDQATKLYGAQHYDHYDYLLAITDRLGDIGLEHHRSSENSQRTDYFTKWDDNPAGRDLLTHEYTHSWNGKFRRPADLWTPDYRTPMRDSLLWVYEGQTQFWGNVLAVRSGLMSRAEGYDALAATAAAYENLPGRDWRPLEDTTSDEIINPRRPQAYRSYQRFEDYYSEGQLVWLEADALIREKSGGRKSLDDFARTFFGIRDGDWGELTYTFDDIVAALNKILPYDWATFLHDRVYTIRPHAPLEGITKGGYKLVYTDEPGIWWLSNEKARHMTNLTYSIGVVMGKDGAVTSVQWDSPAFKAGIAPGTKIVAIDGQAYSDDDLKTAITNAKGGTAPIRLLIKQDDAYRTVDVVWHGGLRYPHLERVGKGPSGLDALYAPRK